ncbi:MAG: type I-E CRISPR-associated protein Cas6/Cse3/CasE [Desulfomonilaceae bacterium]
MYLSCLLIDVGSNPDRPRPGRLWLRNLYRVHQRLCMAFPSAERKDKDPQFLDPYRPMDFSGEQGLFTESSTEIHKVKLKDVHTPRDGNQGFLYRIDPQLGSGRAVILVQSGVKPDWDYAFQNARHLLAVPAELKPFNPRFQLNQRLRFRILANPVRKVSSRSLDFAGKPFDERWKGKEVPVPTADLDNWLQRRAEPVWSAPKNSEDKQSRPGFRLVEITNTQSGYIYVNKRLDRNGARRLRSVRYEGILVVTDADTFGKTLARGIGPGKAFGFGLLSVTSEFPPP